MPYVMNTHCVYCAVVTKSLSIAEVQASSDRSRLYRFFFFLPLLSIKYLDGS